MASLNFELPDRPALVVGGAGDLGRPIVSSLRGSGLEVGVLDLEAEQGPNAVRCDATDPDAVEEAVARLADELGDFGSLVCAAGLQSEAALADLTLAEFRRILDASLISAFLATKAAAPRMADGGSIVIFSSGLGVRGMARGPHYAAAKAGIVGLVKSLALELGPRRIRVNAIAPGPIRGRMLDGMDPGGLAARGGDSIPLGRIGEPADVVGPVLFLLSSASAYVTGTVLHVNGGMLMP
jgi:3-oxoacyl-[acyl-carrier protein] reductase